MSFPGFAIGAQQAENTTARRNAIKDEERQAELANIANAGLSPEAQAEALRTLYQKDPGAFKQHVSNLIGRLRGQQPQPIQPAYAAQSATYQEAPVQVGDVSLPAPPAQQVTNPGARTNAERRAQILSGGKSQAEQQSDLYRSQLEAQQDAQPTGAQRTMAWLQSLPPEQQRVASSILGVYPRPILKEFVSPDGKQRQYFDASDPASIPSGWNATGGTLAPIKGTMVRSPQSPTGYAQTYVDRNDPSRVVAWQPITPSRWYTGFTSSSTTTDPFGLTSTTARTTNPATSGSVDLSGVTAMPAEEEVPTPEQSGQAAPPTTKAPAPKKSTASRTKTATSSQLDQSGHIPDGAANESLVQAANQLLDGMDVDKLPLPQRDREAAAALASKYGWVGQGTFTPQQKVLINEAGAKLQQLADSPSLSVLDNNTSRAKIAAVLHASSGKSGMIGNLVGSQIAGTLAPQEQEFVRVYNAAVGVISGLGPITRGNRATEAAVQRLMIELPSILQSGSSSDAKLRVQQLLQEIQVAQNKTGRTRLGATTAPSSPAPKVLKYNPATGNLE